MDPIQTHMLMWLGKLLFHKLVHVYGLFVGWETAPSHGNREASFRMRLIKFGHCFNAKIPATVLPVDAFVWCLTCCQQNARQQT